MPVDLDYPGKYSFPVAGYVLPPIQTLHQNQFCPFSATLPLRLDMISSSWDFQIPAKHQESFALKLWETLLL